jgi:hypothetical protein
MGKSVSELLKFRQLQGRSPLTPDQRLCPWTPLGQSPQFLNIGSLSALAMNVVPPLFKPWIRLCYGGNCELRPNEWLRDPWVNWVMGKVCNEPRGSLVKLRDPSSNSGTHPWFALALQSKNLQLVTS